MGSTGREGNAKSTSIFPTFFFNKDTWNIAWMVVE
jgi:hypothetical protein